MELNLTLSVEDGQKILDVLIEKPYKEVFELINKIQEQANEQMKDK